MAVPKSIHDAKGLWQGTSQLNLPWLAPDKRVTESQSSLHIDTDGHDTFATITYTWSHEGKRQEGTLILCGPKTGKDVQMGWVDSWHENAAVLHLTGDIDPSGLIKAKGSYSAGKEDWGWTIAFRIDGGSLTMEMENVTPDGKAEWAVKATYKKA